MYTVQHMVLVLVLNMPTTDCIANKSGLKCKLGGYIINYGHFGFPNFTRAKTRQLPFQSSIFHLSSSIQYHYSIMRLSLDEVNGSGSQKGTHTDRSSLNSVGSTSS